MINMNQEYASVSVEMPENDKKNTLSQNLIYEVENHDIIDDFTLKF